MESEEEITKSEDQGNSGAGIPYSEFQLPDHMREMLSKLIRDRRIRDVSESRSEDSPPADDDVERTGWRDMPAEAKEIHSSLEQVEKVDSTEAYDVMASASDEGTGVSFQERERPVAGDAEFDDPEGIPI